MLHTLGQINEATQAFESARELAADDGVSCRAWLGRSLGPAKTARHRADELRYQIGFGRQCGCASRYREGA